MTYVDTPVYVDKPVSRIEHHLPIYHVSSVQAASFTNTTYGAPKKHVRFHFNPGNLDRVKAIYFEALLGVTPPNTAYAKLRNATDGVDVVEVSSPSATPTKRRSEDIKDLLPPEERQYEADWRVDGGTGEIYQARLVVVQG
ncbi:MAG: hypothetical protein ACE5Z5_05760 [Candidatus Bathyarchaeia archaeon]